MQSFGDPKQSKIVSTHSIEKQRLFVGIAGISAWRVSLGIGQVRVSLCRVLWTRVLGLGSLGLRPIQTFNGNLKQGNRKMLQKYCDPGRYVPVIFLLYC